MTMHRLGTSFAALALLTWSATATVADGRDDATAAIRQTRRAMNQAFAERDMAKLGSFIAGNITFSGPVWRLVGLEQVSETYKQFWKQRPDVSWDYQPIEITPGTEPQNQNWAAERGTWLQKWAAADGPVELRGTYLSFWRQVDGHWMLDAHLFVTISCQGGAFCRAPLRQPADGH